jgi:hypothetical protein
MKNLIVRCSSLSKMMTNARSKSEELSATTKTWLKEMVKEEFYGYRKQLDTPAINKGIDFENLSIDLLNEATFNSYTKNEERKTNDWLTGEADIVAISSIEDVKTSWSLETFPAFQEDANAAVKKSGYDWQLRGYMMLYNKPQASIRYCMISTPDSLLKDWDNRDIHKVDKIDPNARVSTVTIDRDVEIEAKIKERYVIANKYYQQYLNEIINK